MDQNVVKFKELARLFAEYKKLDFPITGGVGYLDELLVDVQIELADEDGYLAGLVDTYLSYNRIDVKGICIDISIDSQIDHAIKTTTEGQEILQRFKAYRQKMWELAKLLSSVSGIPIEGKRGSGL